MDGVFEDKALLSWPDLVQEETYFMVDKDCQ